MFDCSKAALSVLKDLATKTYIRMSESKNLFELAANFWVFSLGWLIFFGIFAMISPILLLIVIYEALGFRICR
jgi:hypothetical protein